MAEPTDVDRRAQRLLAAAEPGGHRALLDALMSGQVANVFEKFQVDQEPALRPTPTEVRGLRIRLDLHGAKPPVWRRIELPDGDAAEIVGAAWHNVKVRTQSSRRLP